MPDRICPPRKSGSPILRVLAMCLSLLCPRFSAPAQTTNVITPALASFSSIQTYMNQGGPVVVLLQFDTTVSMTSPIEVTADTTLDGTGHTVILQGGSANGIFLVDAGVTFKMINVTIAGGQSVGDVGVSGVAGGSSGTRGNNGGGGGGGLDVQGGAINNVGTSVFIGCIFQTNTATAGAGGVGGAGGNGSSQAGNGGGGGAGGRGFGGAVYNTGSLVLSNCTFTGNIAVGGAGGAGGTNGTGATAFPGNGGAGGFAQGGAVYNLGRLTIVNSSFYDNLAEGGASEAGETPNGSGNGATGAAGPVGEGGAIFNLGTNTALNSTFYQNFAAGGVGGNGGNASFGFFAGLGGNGGNAYGGSIYNGGNALIALTNCTFSANVVVGATNGNNGTGPSTNGSPVGGVGFGAHIANVGGSFFLKNTILASPTNSSNAYGLTTNSDQGNNLSSDSTPVFVMTNSTNSIDPKFFGSIGNNNSSGILSSNGGPTLTIALKAGSPAIDAIYDNSAPAFDQRGAARPAGARSDIGAYEFGGVFSNLFTISGQVTMGTRPFPGVTVTAGTSSSTTDTNGNYSLLLPFNTYSVQPKPSAFFNPSGQSVTGNSSNNITGINFNATNVFTGFSVSTNTNSVLVLTISNFTIPNYTFVIQATTNFPGSSAVWTNLATNNSGSTGVFTFSTTIITTNSPQGFFRTVPLP
jgi:hypothetical protein